MLGLKTLVGTGSHSTGFKELPASLFFFYIVPTGNVLYRNVVHPNKSKTKINYTQRNGFQILIKMKKCVQSTEIPILPKIEEFFFQCKHVLDKNHKSISLVLLITNRISKLFA